MPKIREIKIRLSGNPQGDAEKGASRFFRRWKIGIFAAAHRVYLEVREEFRERWGIILRPQRRNDNDTLTKMKAELVASRRRFSKRGATSLSGITRVRNVSIASCLTISATLVWAALASGGRLDNAHSCSRPVSGIPTVIGFPPSASRQGDDARQEESAWNDEAYASQDAQDNRSGMKSGSDIGANVAAGLAWVSSLSSAALRRMSRDAGTKPRQPRRTATLQSVRCRFRGNAPAPAAGAGRGRQ